jgi:hypothetical protein
MNLSWHIAKKDVRRFRTPLLVLCVVTMIRVVVGICLLRSEGSDHDWFGRMAVYANVLWGIGLFLTYMLVGSVIHEDSVAKEAFWQTRPISGATLLGGKCLGLFLMFGLLPVLLLIPWWLGCGFGWPEIWRAIVETVALQLFVVLLALPWSVVTGDDGRFLLWTVVVAVAFLTAALMVAGQTKVAQPDLLHRLGMARLMTVVLLAAVGSVCVAFCQFMTRRTIASVVLILITALSMASIGHWGKWSFSKLWLPKISPPDGVAKGVKISFGNAYEWLTTDGFGVGRVDLVATPVPSNFILLPLFSEQRLLWEDGSFTDNQEQFEQWGSLKGLTSTRRLLRLVPESPYRDWMEYDNRRLLLPHWSWNPNNAGKYTEFFTMVFSPRTMTRLLSEKPEYDATVWFRVMQPEVVGETEVRTGSEFLVGARSSRLVAIENGREKQDLWLSFVERSPEYLWTDLLNAVNLIAWPIRPAYFLVNRARTYTTEEFNSNKVDALIGDVSIALRKVGYRSRNRWNALKHAWEMETGDFDGSTVAEVDYREIERFSFPIQGQFSKRATGPGGFSSTLTDLKGKYSVSGEVSRAGDFDLGPGVTLIYALRVAGGVSDRANLHGVELRRSMPDGSSSTTIVDVQSWLEGDSNSIEAVPVLQPGDTVFVPAVAAGRSP